MAAVQNDTFSSAPTIAFFGATGGCAQAALMRTLNAGYHATALARSPKKLTDMLVSNGVNKSTISSYLTIIEGDVHDSEAVKRTLVSPVSNKIANIVMSGIGSYPKMKLSLTEPIAAIDPTLCGDTAKIILTSLAELKPAEHERPIVVAVSTTGISKVKRDVPSLLVPMYKIVLAAAHRDKRVMEEALIATQGSPQSPIQSFVVVRASLLMNGPGKGLQKVKAGWEWPTKAHEKAAPRKSAGAAVGYSITRDDVGAWIYENLIRGSDNVDRWAGKMVTLTN